ncbi:PAS domain-containing protein [Streptomyces sp. NPDC018031]|uniref:PAS domain-containing protein n=1 Tax=Streptomyces sp. NPDC018031 TaxID=3365033 RepID=UPI0037B87BCF
MADGTKLIGGTLAALRHTLAELDAGVCAVDENCVIVAVSPRAEDLLARPAAELVGEDPHDLLHRAPDGAVTLRSKCRLLHAFLSRRTAHGTREWFARGDGTVVPVAWLAAPYRLDGGAVGAVVLFRENEPAAVPPPPAPGPGPGARPDPGPGRRAVPPPAGPAARAPGQVGTDLADRLTLVAEVTAVASAR